MADVVGGLLSVYRYLLRHPEPRKLSAATPRFIEHVKAEALNRAWLTFCVVQTTSAKCGLPSGNTELNMQN